MKALKPIFFGKYKTNQTFSYDKAWVDLSFERKNGHFSILAKSAPNARATIILSHPMIHYGKYFFVEYGYTNLYEKLGYNIVIFDYNGFGESADNGYEFTQDLLDALETTHQYFGPELPIGMHGVSFGAGQIILGGIKAERQLSGLVIESAVSSNVDYYKGRAKNLYHILNLYSSIFPKKNEHNIFYNQIHKIKNLPLLFIYGKNDVKTPLWMGEKLYKNVTSFNKQFEVFDAKHLTILREQPEKYEQVVADYWANNF